ncbi:HNH endonuclease [Tellurirhabdus rosea]|uniref:HNH endonuclease n=1 Tax=Tellurirhabdus rosea TaxID=2674997 RepID=UPI002254E3A1|nr:HNH endonuclease [Tellurirhabdus rosea]
MSRIGDYISPVLRQRVAERAFFQCVYCLFPEENTFFRHQVDHIISLKHGGTSEFANLAYSCWLCNSFKGSDIASIDWSNGQLFRFYNPRVDVWSEHFKLNQLVIDPLSSIGAVTAAIFRFNDPERIEERKALF